MNDSINTHRPFPDREVKGNEFTADGLAIAGAEGKSQCPQAILVSCARDGGAVASDVVVGEDDYTTNGTRSGVEYS